MLCDGECRGMMSRLDPTSLPLVRSPPSSQQRGTVGNEMSQEGCAYSNVTSPSAFPVSSLCDGQTNPTSKIFVIHLSHKWVLNFASLTAVWRALPTHLSVTAKETKTNSIYTPLCTFACALVLSLSPLLINMVIIFDWLAKKTRTPLPP